MAQQQDPILLVYGRQIDLLFSIIRFSATGTFVWGFISTLYSGVTNLLFCIFALTILFCAKKLNEELHEFIHIIYPTLKETYELEKKSKENHQ